MSAKRALVTGAAGFVGACLTRRLLAEGHQVEAVVRPGGEHWRLQGLDDVTIHLADLRDEAAVQAALRASRPEWIFHVAAHGAYSWQRDPQSIFESNVLGTSNLLRASVQQGFDAFIHAGSSSEYGVKDHPPSEDEAPEPNSDYAVAKVAATLLCQSLAARSGLHLVTLRLYSAYGPWEDPRRLMPTLVARGLRGELPPLVDPNTARDFVYIDDVTDAFILAADAGAAANSGIYNVGSGRQATIELVVEAARSALEIAAEPVWGSYESRDWDTNVWVADPSKIERELAWRAQRDLSFGLLSLKQWLESSPDLWQRYGVPADS